MTGVQTCALPIFLTGEYKWSPRPLDVDAHLHLVRDLEDLARSGQSWADRALSPEGRHLYVSAGGFSEHFRSRAAEHGRIRLVSLEEMY